MAAPSIQGRDRLAFLLALVPYLMEQQQVSVAAAAAHFGVEPALIRDSVRLIGVSGVPGETGSYQHEDLFDIDWDLLEQRDEISLTHLVVIDDSPRFSAREASALIAGLQYLRALPDHGSESTIDALMAKLAIGSSGRPGEMAVGDAPVPAALGAVRAALESGRELSFDYRAADGGRERRTADPLRVESLDRDWYLRAWCHLRQAVRTFRLDRMDAVEIGGPAADRSAEQLSVPEAFFQPSTTDLAVTVEVEHSAVPMIAEYFTAETASRDAGERAEISLRLGHVHGFKRVVTSLAGLARVSEPASARAEVAEWARRALAQYPESEARD